MKQSAIIFLAFAFFSPALATVTETQASTANTTRTCNIDILRNYGLHGLEVAEELPLVMCPDIVHSCCQESDQLEFYFNWIGGDKKSMIREHYKDFEDSYANFLDEIGEVHNFVERTIRVTEDLKTSNCKFAAQLLNKFRIKELSTDIKRNFRKMEQLFVETYQGFYCSMCNHDNHKYINKEAKTLTFSTKFCRDIVESTLPTLIFFYDDIILYLNFATRFLESCNYKAVYKSIEDVPDKLKFKPDEKLSKTLNDCAENRNKQSWLNSCAPICENFSIARLNEFFEPRRKEIENYIEYIKKVMQKHKSMDGKEEKKSTSSRILEEKPKDGAKPAEPTKPKITGPAVYLPIDSKDNDLEVYKILFEDTGISLHDEGRNSLINHQTYVEVKGKVEAAASEVNGEQRGLRLIRNSKSFFRRLFSFLY